MNVVVLAAGKSTRFKTETPKVLHDLAGRPMLGHVLASLAEADLFGGRPVVVVGHKADVVRARFRDARVAWVEQSEQLGTGHAVKVVREAVDAEQLMVVYGDTPLLRARTLRSLAEAHLESEAAATILTFEPDDPKGYGRIVRGADGGVLRIVEDSDATTDDRNIREVNSGIGVFETRLLFEALDTISSDNEQGEYYLTDVVAALNGEGRSVGTWKLEDHDEVRGINNRRELAEVATLLRRRIQDQHMAAGVTLVDPATTYIECGVDIGADTVIEPCSVIRRGVKIGRGCRVGPFATVRGDTVLADGAVVGNFTEVKSSRFGAGSKAKHLAYVGDATLGAGVNVGAGTIFANYDGEKKHPTEVGDGSFIGSGTVLVAPVKVGKGSRTGAGAVVTRGRDVADGQTVVGVPARPLPRRDGA